MMFLSSARGAKIMRAVLIARAVRYEMRLGELRGLRELLWLRELR